MTEDQANVEDIGARIQAFEAKLASHPGNIAYWRWAEIRRTIDLHYRNLRELDALIRSAETNEELALELIQNAREPVVRLEFTGRLDQRLHNALASAVTVVDHARRLLTNYAGTPFESEFNYRNDAIRLDPRAVFIRDLRNYLLHYGNLPIGHSLSINDVQGRQDFDSSVTLDTSMLKLRDGWKAGSKTFLESASKSIDLGELVRWYEAASREFHGWFLGQFDEMHGVDVAEVNNFIEAHHREIYGFPERDLFERVREHAESSDDRGVGSNGT